jgi:hypothetical protein
VKIPAFVLKRLYVPGSLRSTDEGLAFVLRNHMATATLTELRALRINGRDVAPAQARVRVGGVELDVQHVTAAAPLVFGRGDDAEVQVRGLAVAGPTKVRLEVQSAEFGELVIEFEDRPA